MRKKRRVIAALTVAALLLGILMAVVTDDSGYVRVKESTLAQAAESEDMLACEFIIGEVYPGTKYEDTCLPRAEAKLYTMTQMSSFLNTFIKTCISPAAEEKNRVIKEAAEGSIHPQVSLLEIGEEYELVLFDQNGQIIYTNGYGKKPQIKEVTEDLIEVTLVVGNPARYTFYFDAKKGTVSEIYFNSIFLHGPNAQYVFYVDEVFYSKGQGVAILQELFGSNRYIVERDFSPFVSPVIRVRLYNGETLELVYWQGEDAVEVRELISLKKGGKDEKKDNFLPGGMDTGSGNVLCR